MYLTAYLLTPHLQVVLPELAVLRFGVYEDNGKLLGQRILPFNDLQAGYRHIALRTEGNFPMSLPMLFCNIDLKIYIPDGLSGFMDALSDPRAFLSAQEKRAEQLKALGIAESDIGTDIIEGVPKKLPQTAAKKPIEKPEELKFDQITVDALKQEKTYNKAVKKFQKEMEALKKKQLKEKTLVQKNQIIAMEKFSKSKSKNNLYDSNSALRDICGEQTGEYTELVERHRREEWDLTKTHLIAQDDMLRTIMEGMQAQQMKELEALFERDNKEMKSNQAKASVETLRDVQNDKSLKTKAEKERIIREKNANNTKRFIDERKTQAMKQANRREKLRKQHGNEIESLQKYLEGRAEMYKMEEIEIKLASKPEFYC